MSASTREIAFLHLGQTHDEFPDVVAALSRLGIRCHLVHLYESDGIDWSRYAAINVRECRTYHLDADFLARLEHIHTRIDPLDFTNPMAVVRGTLDKATYLPVLERAGVDLVPNYCPPEQADPALEAIFETTGWNDIVVKPTVSSKSWNTFRLRRSGGSVSIWASGQPAPRHYPSLAEGARFLCGALQRRAFCVQRFMPEIESRGETSFVFLGGHFSHAVHKATASNGWLAHEFYGGTNTLCSVAARDVSWAEEILGLLVRRYGQLCYGRIDAIPDSGKLRLLECELVVPRLFLREGCAVERYAGLLSATLRRRD